MHNIIFSIPSNTMIGSVSTLRACVPAASRSVRASAQATPTEGKRAPGPLERGGTLKGEKAAGKDAAAATLAKEMAAAQGTFMSIQDGKFVDDR